MIFTITGKKDDFKPALEAMNKYTREWTMRAARGECAWVCASCSCTFPEGMPDKCEWDQQQCTDIIIRDKQRAENGGTWE